jgi:phosphoribosylformylglycinamidine cyclo-ligase
MSRPPQKSTTYADAGVSIEHGDQLVDRIAPHARRTQRKGVMGSIGGFGALFDLKPLGYADPILVSGTDGVGTKLKLAVETGRHQHIGIDLVAMCANDVLVQGAEPLFFLDYFACGRLDVAAAETVIAGIARGCELAGCALVGGETAEMPGMYADGDYDLAGFCVGAVERDRIIDGRSIAPDDVLIALPSSGAHANGYSLVRKILAQSSTPLSHELGGRPLAELLMEPTRIYVKPVLELLAAIPVNGIVHVTGGGLPENLPRVLPDSVAVQIDCASWTRPELFDWLQRAGNVPGDEMFRVFNCGVGLVLMVAAAQRDAVLSKLRALGESPWVIGTVVPRVAAAAPVVLLNPHS